MFTGSFLSRGALIAAALAMFLLAAVPGTVRAASCDTASSGGEGIEDFASDVVVNPDATVTVRETIRVLARGQQLVSEIYRDFPSHFQDSRGHVYAPAIQVLDVRRDGMPVSYQTRRLPEGLRVYLGTPDAPLSPGEYTYTLAYRVAGSLGFFADGDQLYWPVTPSRWTVPIDCATATIQVPPGVPTVGIHATGWVGQEDSPDRLIDASVDRSGVITYVAPGPLEGEHGLTASVSWPRGFVQEPVTVGQTWPLIGTGQTGPIELIGLLPVLLYVALVLVRVRRKPRRGPVAPTDRPPDQLSPAATRFLASASFDERTLAATILDLAVKGFLTIREVAPGSAATDGASAFELVKAIGRTGGPRLAPEEGAALAEIFGAKTTRGLGGESFRDMRRASSEIKRLVGALYEDHYFTNHARYLVPALFLTTATLAAAAMAETNRAALDLRSAVIWFVVAWALVGGTAFVLGSALLMTRFRTRQQILAFGGTASAAYLITLLGAFVMLSQIARSSIAVVVLLGGLGVVLALFRKLLATPTRAGHRSRERVDEFRAFLVASTPSAGDDDPERRWNGAWEAYLPYAVALDVDERWVWPLLRPTADADPDSPRRHPGVTWYEAAEPGADLADDGSLGDRLTAAVRDSLRGPTTTAK